MAGQQQFTSAVDVLIVGSGPIGATYARVLSEGDPRLTLLMAELGPQLTDRPGVNVKNIDDLQERSRAQVMSQGSTGHAYNIPTASADSDVAPATGPGGAPGLSRPGTHLVDPDDPAARDGLPEASISSNVGGMGAHWSCACPRPGNAERVPFIPAAELDAALRKAEELMGVVPSAFAATQENQAILSALSREFDAELPPGRKVQTMPMAARVAPDGRITWMGADTILGPLAGPGKYHGWPFELRSETICRRVFVEDGRVTGALLEHRPTGTQTAVSARVVVLAADPLRTPQLLWASGIRPRALGHYLNDHSLSRCAVVLNPELVAQVMEQTASGRSRPWLAGLMERVGWASTSLDRRGKKPTNDPLIGSFWVPFSDPEHPFHAQIMHLDLTPDTISGASPKLTRAIGSRMKGGRFDLRGGGSPSRHIVGMGWGPRKDIRYEDRVEFSDTETDEFGMPKMRFHYELTDSDRELLDEAMKVQARAAAALGEYVLGEEPKVVPAGSSLHYQGTVRMGERDDGRSVCDSYSQVWGIENLFVGGNGVIPTATTGNPLPTSIALAVRSCERVLAMVSPESEAPARLSRA